MPINADVLARVRKDSRAEQIAWGVNVAFAYVQSMMMWLNILKDKANTAHYCATLERLRDYEDHLIEETRAAARYANFALDALGE